MPGPMFLDGDDVALRTIELEDVDYLQELVNDPQIRARILRTDPINSVQEREWIESHGDGDYHFLVCVDGEPVGTVGLGSENDQWGTTELGYMIDPDHWGNGYATEAARLASGYALDERRLNKVYASALETNPASARVLEKVGFEREGVHRQEAFVDGEYVDVHRYGLLAAEWRSE